MVPVEQIPADVARNNPRRYITAWLRDLARRAAYGPRAAKHIRYAAERIPRRVVAELAFNRMLSLVENAIVSLDWNRERLEQELIHQARINFADDAQSWEREQKRERKRKVAYDKDGDDPKLDRAIDELAVRQTLISFPEEEFMVLDCYFPLGDREAAAKILSILFKREISPRQYDRALERSRRKWAGMFIGCDGPYAGPLGPWPDSYHNRRWPEDCEQIGDLFNEVRQERKRTNN